MKPTFYESERAVRLDQLKRYGKLKPERVAVLQEQLRQLKATPEKYKDNAKISTLEILLEVRG